MNNVDPVREKQIIHGLIPSLVVGIVAFLGLVVPYIVIASEFASNSVASYKSILFLALLIASALSVSNVRIIKDNTIKSVIYLIIGFTVFWIIGAAYTGSYLHLRLLQPENTQYFKIFNTDFIPITLFAIANTITVLVALIEGKKNAFIFGSMGLAAMFFPIVLLGFDFVDSRPDMFLLLVFLWAFIPTRWVRLLTPIINDLSFSIEKRFVKVLKSSILISFIYILVGLLMYFVMTGSSTTVDTFSLPLFINEYKPQLMYFALTTGYFFVLPNVILIMGIFPVYEFALHAFNVRREVAHDGTFVYITQKKKEAIPAVKKEYDPFEDIIKEMKEFKKEFGRGKINRIMAAQKIGTLREQVDFLNSKYDIGSKANAAELLKQIERESEFAFK
ncbi:MAG: hypothetical protein P1P72_08540 [ANME-2 cluster archaeon]|nr:hypothetical protein [ANME-2 cluster archaeon]